MTTPTTPVEGAPQQPVVVVTAAPTTSSRWPYYAIAALSIVLGLTVWIGVKSYHKALAAADVQYAALKAQNASDTVAITAHTATRTAQAQQVQIADTVRSDRDSASEILKAKIVVANATDADVKLNADKILGGDVALGPDGTFNYKKEAVQQFTATKVDDEEQSQDNADLEKKVVTLNDMVSSSAGDLATCETDKAATYKDLLAYKKAATKSKWAKILDGGEKVAIFGAGLVIAHEIDKH